LKLFLSGIPSCHQTQQAINMAPRKLYVSATT
jgi:hypothetical protein